jgi:AraC-like DNA-binding protein
MAEVELVSGFIEHDPFPPLLVDAFFVGYYVHGAVELMHRGRQLPLAGGDVALYEPNELVHSGPRATDRSVFHIMIMSRAAMERAAVDIAGRSAPESFGLRILHGPSPAGALQRFVDAVTAEASPLEQETRFIESVAALLGQTPRSSAPPPASSAQVKRACAFLHAHAGRTVSLDQLAAEAGGSKYHLVRTFHEAMGLPPHKYHLRLRLGRARELLAAGVSAADVALEIGFADQSHFYRAFKRAFGITPGAWTALLRR